MLIFVFARLKLQLQKGKKKQGEKTEEKPDSPAHAGVKKYLCKSFK